MNTERLTELKKCLSSADAPSCLERAIAEMLARGVSDASLLADLHYLRSEARQSGDEAGEDTILDVMDRIVGWCSPGQRFQ
jgi:hypothetical protein